MIACNMHVHKSLSVCVFVCVYKYASFVHHINRAMHFFLKERTIKRLSTKTPNQEEL